MSDQLEKYIEELSTEFEVNEMNLRDVQMKLPARKHYWAAKLVNHTRERYVLEAKKKKIIDDIVRAIISNGATSMPQKQMEYKARNHESVMKIQEKIDYLDILIELLNKAADNFRSMTWDIKNITRIIELEQA